MGPTTYENSSSSGLSSDPRPQSISSPEDPIDKCLFATGLRYAVTPLVVFSILVRLTNIASPLLEHYHSRQTQTAFPVWTFIQEGISLFSYQLPIFGPPWQFPLEFPTFQVTAALLVKMGVTNIDAACRATNILYFYLSALFLYLVCKLHFERAAVSRCILLFYLWCPFTLVWSRASMIDYASVAFALGYFYFFLRWLRPGEKKLPLFVGALACGVLGYLTKVTTMPTVVLPLGYFVVREMTQRISEQNGPLWHSVLTFLLKEKDFVVSLLCLIVIPFAVGYLWAEYADQVRSSLPFTKWAATERLSGWLYGTWSQKMNITNWKSSIMGRIMVFFLPCYWIYLLPAGLWFAYNHKRSGRDLVYSTSLACIITIFIFFNLYYVHEYYFIAVSPFVAIAVGVGLYQILFVVLRRKYWMLVLVVILLAYSALQPVKWYVLKSYRTSYDDPLCKLGAFLNAATRPEEYIIVTDYNYNSTILYYAKRKGFMFESWFKYGKKREGFFKKHNFTTIVSKKKHPELFSIWKHAEKIYSAAGFDVYKVYDDPSRAPTANNNLLASNHLDTKVYRWGTTIDFSFSGNAQRYQTKGWSIGGEKSKWTLGGKATLTIPITTPKSGIFLRATFIPFLSPGRIDRQTVHVFIGGQKAGEWVITKAGLQERSLRIPRNFFGDKNRIVITFNTPDAVSPKQVGIGNDSRRLGIRMHKLKLEEIDLISIYMVQKLLAAVAIGWIFAAIFLDRLRRFFSRLFYRRITKEVAGITWLRR